MSKLINAALGLAALASVVSGSANAGGREKLYEIEFALGKTVYSCVEIFKDEDGGLFSPHCVRLSEAGGPNVLAFGIEDGKWFYTRDYKKRNGGIFFQYFSCNDYAQNSFKKLKSINKSIEEHCSNLMSLCVYRNLNEVKRFREGLPPKIN